MSTTHTEDAVSAEEHDELLHDRAEAFVAGMDRTERVTWLQRQGVTDQQILDAMLDPEDRDLDEFTREQAHAVASAVANGALGGDQVPQWLR